MNALDRVSERVHRLGDPNDPAVPRALLSLEEFFHGNSVHGSICCNLDPCPHPQEVFAELKRIRGRPGVSDIRVQVTVFDDPDWPFSDTVWIFTDAHHSMVREWLPAKLRPDQCWEGWVESESYEPLDVFHGHKPVAIWWD